MKLIKKTKRYFLLLLLLCPFYSQSQVIVRLVEAEFSATANLTAYLTTLIGEEAMKRPLERLRNVSFEEIAFFSVTSEFYSIFLVEGTITQ